MVKCPYCDSKECEYVGADDDVLCDTWQCQDCLRVFEVDWEVDDEEGE